MKMYIFAIFLFCVQACLGQKACNQFIGTGLNTAYAPRFAPRFAPAMIPAIRPTERFAPAPYSQAYGGEGMGDIAIAGRMPVAGTTAVKGQVPILGSVRFGGDVPAAGTVTITGSSGCRGRYF